MIAALSLTPVVAGFLAGTALRRTGMASVADGRFLLLLNLVVCMPALMLRSVARVPLTVELAIFPLAALVMVATGRLIGAGVSRHVPLGPDRAVLVMGFMVVNAAFALPFVEAVYGDPGVARLATFDVVNNALVMSWVYAVAARASPAVEQQPGVAWRLVLRTPPLYAVVAGLLLNVTGTAVPTVVTAVVDVFAAASPLLISVGTGLLLRPGVHGAGRALVLATARPVIGLCVAALLATALRLDGVDRGVLLLLGAAPMGFVVVTFASLEKLDAELAAQCLAVSLITGFVLSTVVALTMV